MFRDLSLQDQMALLKAGCTEILFIKANYTYDPTKRALTLGPDIMYTRESFLQGECWTVSRNRAQGRRKDFCQWGQERIFPEVTENILSREERK